MARILRGESGDGKRGRAALTGTVAATRARDFD
jgi:hypothetical protein